MKFNRLLHWYTRFLLVVTFVLPVTASADAAPTLGEMSGTNPDSPQESPYTLFIPVVLTESDSVAMDDIFPITVTEPDGTIVQVGIMPMPEEVIERAVTEGVLTETEATKIREEQAAMAVSGSDLTTCTWFNDWYSATLRGSGRDSDNDFYEDYEQPEGTQYGYCVTPFFWAAKGWPNSFLQAPHYGPSLFRRHMIIGLTGFPDWFAAAQASLILHN